MLARVRSREGEFAFGLSALVDDAMIRIKDLINRNLDVDVIRVGLELATMFAVDKRFVVT